MVEELGNYGNDDGVYVVKVYPVTDQRQGRIRTRWRADGYYTGHRAGTLTRSTFGQRESAVACADALWSDYIAGLHTAPDAAPTTVSALIDKFLERTHSKKGRLLSPATAQAYRTQLASLTRVTGPDWPVNYLSKRHVEAVLRAPRVQRNVKKTDGSSGRAEVALSLRTIEQTLRAIRAFSLWALGKGWLAHDITEGVVFDAGPEVMRPWMQPNEIGLFLDACAPAHRIRAGLMIETGLRTSEAANLHWSWIQRGIGRPSIRIPAKDPLTAWTCKGKRARAIPLSERAQQFLAEAEARWGKDGYVLHNQPKPPETTNWCADTHTACRRAGVTDTDTHGLRRTAGAIWLASGVDIYRVSRLLGHASVTTT
jgi:integrase